VIVVVFIAVCEEKISSSTYGKHSCPESRQWVLQDREIQFFLKPVMRGETAAVEQRMDENSSTM
jgi:hypothetical protein